MIVSDANGITMETIEEAISKEYLDNLILDAVKSMPEVKNRPDYLFKCDYLSKSLTGSEIAKEIILNKLYYIITNNKLKSKPEKDPYFIINETPLQYRNPSNPRNCKSLKEKSPSKDNYSNETDFNIDKECLIESSQSI